MDFTEKQRLESLTRRFDQLMKKSIESDITDDEKEQMKGIKESIEYSYKQFPQLLDYYLKK